jgi:CTP:molybdopterin cytidylyltransferase MocA
MHYRTKALGLPGRLLFAKADNFLQAAGQPVHTDKDLVITLESLAGQRGVHTLQYEPS